MSTKYQNVSEVVYEYVEDLDSNLVSLALSLRLHRHRRLQLTLLDMCDMSIRPSRPCHYDRLPTLFLPSLLLIGHRCQPAVPYRQVGIDCGGAERDGAARQAGECPDS